MTVNSDSKASLFETMPVKKAIIKFALPCVLSQLITLVYNMADTFFVGRTGDPNQVAALTLCFPIYMILLAIGNLFGIGANSKISRLLGSNQAKSCRSVSAFSIYGSIIVSTIYIVILAVFLRPIMNVVGASNATFGYAKSYIFWVLFIGGLPHELSILLAHLLRAEGRSKEASTGMSAGAILNIMLDPLFIFLFKMDIAGAALATCISNCLSVAFFVVVLLRNRSSTIVSVKPSEVKLPLKTAGEILLVGTPAAIVVILGSTANIVLTHYMRDYGDISVAAFGIVQKIGTMAIQIAVGIAQGVMPLIGYNFAAQKQHRVREIANDSYAILLSFSIICFILIELLAKQLMSLFIDNEETIRIGVQFLRRWIVSAPGMCVIQLHNAIFQAVGKWKQSTLLSVLRQGFVLIPMLIILNNAIGQYGLVWAQPIADMTVLIVGFIMYFQLTRHELAQ